ncbi:interleukin-1 receptor-associated kinase 1 [Spatholobus suberectus]|nr:interleukin-1 receptor-associated kinase 1 [Spatholobus suberectus]
MTVLSSSSRCTQSVAAIVAIILVLFHQSCSAKHHRSLCPASSCGKIRNITYPFRLKGDPRGCGLRRYELDCVDSVTVLTLFSGKYQVQDINYKRSQIRVTDAGVVEDSACSIPRYFLFRYNFTSMNGEGDPDMYDADLTDENGRAGYPPYVSFLNCTNPVTDDSGYVKVNAGRCHSRGHIYAVVGLSPWDMKVGCRLKVVTFANWTLDRNVSYADIRKWLHDGFWLSWWLPLICRDQCGKGVTCSINQTTQQVIGCDGHGNCQICTGKCGISSRILGFAQGVEGIIIEIEMKRRGNRKSKDVVEVTIEHVIAKALNTSTSTQKPPSTYYTPNTTSTTSQSSMQYLMTKKSVANVPTKEGTLKKRKLPMFL